MLSIIETTEKFQISRKIYVTNLDPTLFIFATDMLTKVTILMIKIFYITQSSPKLFESSEFRIRTTTRMCWYVILPVSSIGIGCSNWQILVKNPQKKLSFPSNLKPCFYFEIKLTSSCIPVHLCPTYESFSTSSCNKEFCFFFSSFFSLLAFAHFGTLNAPPKKKFFTISSPFLIGIGEIHLFCSAFIQHF